MKAAIITHAASLGIIIGCAVGVYIFAKWPLILLALAGLYLYYLLSNSVALWLLRKGFI